MAYFGKNEPGRESFRLMAKKLAEAKKDELEKICEEMECHSGYGPAAGFIWDTGKRLRKILGGERTFRCGLCSEKQRGNELYHKHKGYCKDCIKREGFR